MKFAHFTQTFPREGETAADRYDQMWRELELADNVNFDYGFSSVHHFSRLRPTSSTYCTGAAARTKRLRLGPMGYTVGLYNPIRLVERGSPAGQHYPRPLGSGPDHGRNTRGVPHLRRRLGRTPLSSHRGLAPAAQGLSPVSGPSLSRDLTTSTRTSL